MAGGRLTLEVQLQGYRIILPEGRRLIISDGDRLRPLPPERNSHAPSPTCSPAIRLSSSSLPISITFSPFMTEVRK
jgi:hypothetical protein